MDTADASDQFRVSMALNTHIHEQLSVVLKILYFLSRTLAVMLFFLLRNKETHSVLHNKNTCLKKHLIKYISRYILELGGKFMQTARLFVNGRSQAVRLPKEYQFQGADVYIQKVGEAVILFPVDKEWETFLHG
ncbi:hypothetical protein FACS1894102_1180 [Spirochaetia bacterium]|nr:hypothetical protein FACS1894102_1180 [Spirochaetia bacterium]